MILLFIFIIWLTLTLTRCLCSFIWSILLRNFIIVGNGFIGNHLSWNLASSSCFSLGRNFLEDIKKIPTDRKYTLIWSHGISRGDDSSVYYSQYTPIVRILSLIKKHYIEIEQQIYISSLFANFDNSFGKTKKDCENLILNSGIKSLVLRLPNIYGYFKEPKGNSILSKWFLTSDIIRATNDSKYYVSLENLTNLLNTFLDGHFDNLVFNVISDKSTRISDLGKAVSEYRDVFFKPMNSESTIDITDLSSYTGNNISIKDDILLNLDNYIKGSEFANEVFNSVYKSERIHVSNKKQFLFDLDSDEFINLKRVYSFDLIAGEKRGNHYHKEQTEFFSVIDGSCEIYITNKNGFKVSVPMSFGDKIRTNPYLQHAFFSPTNKCIILTSSTLEYVPNSTPDVFKF